MSIVLVDWMDNLIASPGQSHNHKLSQCQVPNFSHLAASRPCQSSRWQREETLHCWRLLAAAMIQSFRIWKGAIPLTLIQMPQTRSLPGGVEDCTDGSRGRQNRNSTSHGERSCAWEKALLIQQRQLEVHSPWWTDVVYSKRESTLQEECHCFPGVKQYCATQKSLWILLTPQREGTAVDKGILCIPNTKKWIGFEGNFRRFSWC